MKIYLKLILGALLTMAVMQSCQRDITYTDDTRLSFGSDTLHFDTAFTKLTTPTQRIKIYNYSNQALLVNRLYLEKESQSYFRMGVSGETGYDLRDITILPNDSTYIFLTALIDSQGSNTPLYITDKIIAETDAGQSDLVIDAYGQDAYFYKDSVIGDISWTAEKPIVLLGNVLVENGKKLTIEKGARIYTQQKKYLLVAGTLEAKGTKEDSIIFQGNRLDRDYFLNIDRPGEWGGIHFGARSTDNIMEHVIVKNATTGIRIDSLSTASSPKLQLSKSVINNCLQYGILSFSSSLSMENCMLHTNNVNLAFIWGGDLYMNFCTLAGYSGPSNQHEERYQSKSMWLLNYYIENNQALPSNLSAKIYNSVIYGSLDDEFGADAVTSANFNVDIENCLIKSEAGLSEWQSLCNSFTGNILNEDPGYENTYDMDFSYQTFSPIYRATSSHLLPMDIEEKLRSNPTDIGAWEL